VIELAAAAVLSTSAPHTLVEELPPEEVALSRKLPIFAVNDTVPCPAKPATTKLFVSCVVRAIDGSAVAPVADPVAPIDRTPEYWAEHPMTLDAAARVTVREVEAWDPPAAVDQISIRVDVPLFRTFRTV
jgi:hypothetical protein